MNYHDGYDDPHGDFRDDDFAFEVACSDCGATYDNRDGYCPNCESSSCSYAGADAARWDDHLRRTGR